MGARYFETEKAMSDHQTERELQEALCVQGMTSFDRWLWLQENWGRLQDGAALPGSDEKSEPGAARCYATLKEKNRFDELREISQALKMPIHTASQS